MSMTDHPTVETSGEMDFLGYDGELALTGGAGLNFHREIAVLAREVQNGARPHYEPVAEQFAALASTHIGGITEAGALLVHDRGGWRVVSSPETTVGMLEQLQRDFNEGPAVDASNHREPVRVERLAGESRWPRFTGAALSRNCAEAILCLPLYTHNRTWGALMLLADDAAVLDGAAGDAGRILATHAALTLEAVHHDRNYKSALGSRDIIGQAKGVLMERFDVDAVAAFSLLTRLSAEAHRPVVVIAKEILDKKAAE
jgi:GAF domain-containing protein